MSQPIAVTTEENTVFVQISAGFVGSLPDLVFRLKRELQGVPVDWVAVREAYLYGRGRPFPIASQIPEASRNEKAKIRLSSDRLTAYLIFYPPKPRGGRLTEAEITRLVEAYGIPAERLDPHSMRLAILRRSYQDPEPIARGCAPVDGEPARVEWERGLPSDPEGFLAATEELDEYPEAVLAEVEAGERAGIRYSPGPGVGGVAADGRTLPARRGRDPVRLGTGLGTSADGRAAVAEQAGHLQLSGVGATSARILPLLRVRDPQELVPWSEKVYPGSVIVEGDLEVTFPVYVLGDLEVRGSVVRSAPEVMGSLFVRDGIIQDRGAPINVGGIVSAGFLERAWAVGRVIHVRRYSLKSRLLAYDAVITPRSGRIQGGQLAACRTIHVGSLGSANAMPTTVTLAAPACTSTFQGIYTAWAEALEAARGEGDHLVEEARRWRDAAGELAAADLREARVEAQTIHPGVVVRMGSTTRQIENAVGPVELLYEQVGSRGRVAMTRR